MRRIMHPAKCLDVFRMFGINVLAFDLSCVNIELFSSCMDGSLIPILYWFSDQGQGCKGLVQHSWRPQFVCPYKTDELHKRAPIPQQRVCKNVQQRPCIMVYFYELKHIFKHDLGCDSGQIEHMQIDSFDRVVWFCWLWHRVCVRICQRWSKRKTFQGTKTKSKVNAINSVETRNGLYRSLANWFTSTCVTCYFI